jgi:Phenazine biosynthesis-like protein
MGFDFSLVDVFSDWPFGGNRLVVFPDATRIADETMQRLAREFNFSETTFVLPPSDPLCTCRVRIFTPRQELPFAGHPTLGTAAVLARPNGAHAARSARRPVRGGDSVRCARRSVWRGGAVPCPCSGADGDRAAQHPAPRLRTISYWYGDACRVKSSAYVPLRASSSECVPDSTTDPSRNT